MKNKYKETETEQIEKVEQNEQTEQVEKVEQTVEETVSNPVEESRVWVYIGPTIRGVVINGTVLSGTRQAVLSGLPQDYKKYPQIERLIVADKALTSAKKQLAEGKGSISIAYNAVAAAIQSATKEV